MSVKSANMVKHFANRTHSCRRQQSQFHKIRKMVLPKLVWVKRAIHPAFRPTFFQHSLHLGIASGNWSHLSLVIYHADKYIWQPSWASLIINGEQQAEFIWCVWGVTSVSEIQRMCSYYCVCMIVGLLAPLWKVEDTQLGACQVSLWRLRHHWGCQRPYSSL